MTKTTIQMKRDENDNEETEASLDSEYDIDEYKLDEQLLIVNLIKKITNKLFKKNQLMI